jgi:integrase
LENINALAKRLGNSSLSHSLIKNYLHVLGYRVSSYRLNRTLDIATAVSPHFRVISGLFPHSSKIISLFIRTSEILDILSQSGDKSSDDKFSDSLISPFTEFIGDQSIDPYTLEQFPQIGECIALFWFLHTYITAVPSIRITDTLRKFLASSKDVVRKLIRYTEENPNAKLWNARLENNLHQWLADAATFLEQITPEGDYFRSSLKNFTKGTEVILNLSAPSPLEHYSATTIDQGSDEEDGGDEFTHQRGALLEERERLTSHHNSFLSDELRTFTKWLLKHFKNEPSAKPSTLDARAEYFSGFIESALTLLALATGRTIAAAVQLSLDSNADEYLEVRRVKLPGDSLRMLIWHRKLPGNIKLSIPLPHFLIGALGDLVSNGPGITIEDCLPYSITPWHDRCMQFIGGHLRGTELMAHRRIRDALARTLYQSSANPALLAWLVTPLDKLTSTRDSLGYYLSPMSRRTFREYRIACKKMFGGYGADEARSINLTRYTYAITDEEHSRIAAHLYSVLETAYKSGDPIQFHNALAVYVLMLLVVSTGHRRSRKPFYFPWDILNEDLLVFVCDKLTTGSEARFVSIPAWVAEMVRLYRWNLQRVANHVKHTNPQLSQDISNYALGIDERTYRKSGKKLSFGMFFLITNLLDGYKGRNINTYILQSAYKEICAKPIPQFRNTAANAMWEHGLSGLQIEAFLGHNHQMHLFGSSSSWTIIVSSIPVQEWQESYLNRHGWKPFHIPEADLERFRSDDNPCFVSGTDSYEGRERDSRAGRARALEVIRKNLPAHWFYKNGQTITDKDIRDLKDRVAQQLSSDPKALSKVNVELELAIESLRKETGNLFDMLRTLPRGEPSPITLTASRHFAVARRIRKWWISRAGSSQINNSPQSVIDRLAEIGISLVVFDAVLDKKLVEATLGAIVTGNMSKAQGCAITRFQTSNKSLTFNKEIVHSPITAALLSGVNSSVQSPSDTTTMADEAMARIGALLKTIGHPDFCTVSNIDRLIEVFRSWWLIRLPGPLLAIATGEQPGPAADLISSCKMYDMALPPNLHPEPKPQMEAKHRNAGDGAQRALSLIRLLISTAARKIQSKSTHTRIQRRRLAQLIDERDVPNDKRKTAKLQELDRLADEQQCVELVLGFLKYLLEYGGKRKRILRFSAIRTYYTNFRWFIEFTWNHDISSYTSEDFDSLYSKIIAKAGKSVDLNTPLQYFHSYLMGFHDAPPSTAGTTVSRAPIPVRDSLITTGDFEEAWEKMPSLYSELHLAPLARAYMYLAYDHAMRPREIIGFKEQYVVGLDPIFAQVSRNSIRDLKTGAGYRMVPAILSTSEHARVFREVVEFTRSAPGGDGHIFDDPEAPGHLIVPTRISGAITRALRASTGNAMVVPYSMRHSAATRLAHRAIRSPRSIPLSAHFEHYIVEPFSDKLYYECIDGGFTTWPFWFDHSAMFSAHAGPDSLLNTYWKSSSLKLAEHTWDCCPVDQFTDQQLANMLGLERSAITHQKKRLLRRFVEVNDSVHPNERLIVHYIGNSTIPALGISDPLEPKKRGRPKKDQTSEDEIDGVDIAQASWLCFHRALCAGLENALPVASMQSTVKKLGIESHEWARFVTIYNEIVTETGFSDFETATERSEPNSAVGGVLHGATIRERALVSIFRLASESEKFEDILGSVIETWIERVSPDDPWFVVKDMDELNVHLAFLAKLGIRKEQLECCHSNLDAKLLRLIKSKLKVEEIPQRSGRISRGYSRAQQSELGLRLKQKKDSLLGDFRDTHRIMLLVAVLKEMDSRD